MGKVLASMSQYLALSNTSATLLMCSGYLRKYMRNREIDNLLRGSLERTEKVLERLSAVYEVAVGREYPTLSEARECDEYRIPGQNDNGVQIIRARFALKVVRGLKNGETVEDLEVQEAISIMEDLGQDYRAASQKALEDEE